MALYTALEAEQRLVTGITSMQIFNPSGKIRAVLQSSELPKVQSWGVPTTTTNGIYQALSQTRSLLRSYKPQDLFKWWWRVCLSSPFAIIWLDQMSVVWLKTCVTFNVCIWEINANSRSWWGKSTLPWALRNNQRRIMNMQSVPLDPRSPNIPAFVASKPYCYLRKMSIHSSTFPTNYI